MTPSQSWFSIGLLPGQRQLLKKEMRSFFFKGYLAGLIAMLIVALVLVFGFFIPEREKYLNSELVKKDERIQKQRDEIGILNGVIFNAFGKSAPLVIEQFRFKEKGTK